jgi:indoleamine 2,3-dioxygenase
VTARNGFLPLSAPPRRLPPAYAPLDEIVRSLPALLAARDGALAAAVAALPRLPVEREADPRVLQALMRDYSVLVSAYLLEGGARRGGGAGGAAPPSPPRRVVPANLAVPFAAVAAAVDEPTIMSYDSYALFNCHHVNEGEHEREREREGEREGEHEREREREGEREREAAARSYAGWVWADLRLVRAFDGGPEEATFVLVHAEIESHSPALVGAYDAVLDALGREGPALPPTPPRLAAVAAGLAAVRDVLQRIVMSQLKMFNASDPRRYESKVRPWIFGWKGNPELPDGVVFEGVAGGAPTFLRGETGAQSTIVPSLDAFLGITHRSDALREMLQVRTRRGGGGGGGGGCPRP